MLITVNDLPQLDDVAEVAQRRFWVVFKVLEHSEVVIVADSLRVVNTESALCDNDGLALETKGGGKVKPKRCVLLNTL